MSLNDNTIELQNILEIINNLPPAASEQETFSINNEESKNNENE